jgi:hypothetical protein
LALGVRRALLSVSIALALTSACHAEKQAESPPARKSEDRPRLTDLDALEHDLAAAEQRLNAQLDKKLALLEDEGGGGADDKAASKKKEPPSQGAEAEPEKDEVRAAEQQQSWRDAELASPCDLACRSLASMKRSATSICAISGEDDPRCERARARVTSAEERVRRAGCACRVR